MLKDKPLIIIFILMLLGFIIRIYSLSSQSLWIDEGFSINAALSILKHGIPLMDSGSYYLGYLLHTYLLSLFILIFRNEIFAGRLLSVLFGTLTIPLVYYLGKELVNKTYFKIVLLEEDDKPYLKDYSKVSETV